jgi:hypothetical protein
LNQTECRPTRDYFPRGRRYLEPAPNNPRFEMKPLTALALAAVLLAGCANVPKATAPTYVDVAQFRAIAVEAVHIAPTASTLNDADRAALESKLRLALVDAIPADVRAATAGPGVLSVEITVTELDSSNPAVNALTTALLFVPMDRGGIAFDATFFDRPGLAAIGSTTVRHRSSVTDLKGSYSRYGHAVDALREWGAGLAESLARS